MNKTPEHVDAVILQCIERKLHTLYQDGVKVYIDWGRVEGVAYWQEPSLKLYCKTAVVYFNPPEA